MGLGGAWISWYARQMQKSGRKQTEQTTRATLFEALAQEAEQRVTTMRKTLLAQRAESE